MATDIGKAYVQIVPSAKGISGSITNALKANLLVQEKVPAIILLVSWYLRLNM